MIISWESLLGSHSKGLRCSEASIPVKKKPIRSTVSYAIEKILFSTFFVSIRRFVCKRIVEARSSRDQTSLSRGSKSIIFLGGGLYFQITSELSPKCDDPQTSAKHMMNKCRRCS